MRALHPGLDGSVVEVDSRLAHRILRADRFAKDSEVILRGAKSELLSLMGNAQTAMCGDVKIADRRPHAKGGVALALSTKNLELLTQEVSA